MYPWILALLVLAAPPDASRADFPEIAQAIDVAAHESPLYVTEDPPVGVARTVAELVAVATRESHLRPDAIGSDYAGFSYGLFQVHETNFSRLHLTWRQAITPLDATRAALVLLAESHRICRGRPIEEQLSEYASGRGRCDTPEGLRDSRNRMALARSLLARRPPYWTDTSRDQSRRAPGR